MSFGLSKVMKDILKQLNIFKLGMSGVVKTTKVFQKQLDVGKLVGKPGAHGLKLLSGLQAMFGKAGAEKMFPGSKSGGKGLTKGIKAMFDIPLTEKGTIAKPFAGAKVSKSQFEQMGGFAQASIAKQAQVGVAAPTGHIGNFLKKIVKPLEMVSKLPIAPLKWMGKVLTKKKFVTEGQLQALGSVVGGLATAGVAAGAMALLGLLQAMSPFTPIFEALTDIFTIYGAILSESFIPVIEELFDVLLSEDVVADITKLGLTFSETLVPAMIASIPYFVAIGKFFIDFLTAIIPLLPVVIALVVILVIAMSPLIFQLLALTAIIIAVAVVVNIVVGFFILLWEVIKYIATGDFFALEEAWQNFINTVLSSLYAVANMVIAGLNLIPGVDITPLSLAQGAIISSPTLAMVGDNPNEPEIVGPISEVKDMMGGGGGDINVNINGYASPEAIDDMARQLLVHKLRRSYF